MVNSGDVRYGVAVRMKLRYWYMDGIVSHYWTGSTMDVTRMGVQIWTIDAI